MNTSAALWRQTEALAESSMKMAGITDWLDDRVQEIIHAPGLHENKADFRDQAKALVKSAEDDGFSVAEIKVACGGDVERYLLDQQNAMTDANRQQRLADDA